MTDSASPRRRTAATALAAAAMVATTAQLLRRTASIVQMLRKSQSGPQRLQLLQPVLHHASCRVLEHAHLLVRATQAVGLTHQRVRREQARPVAGGSQVVAEEEEVLGEGLISSSRKEAELDEVPPLLESHPAGGGQEPERAPHRDLSRFRGAAAAVSQEGFLFSRTVRDNVAYALDGETEEEQVRDDDGCAFPALAQASSSRTGSRRCGTATRSSCSTTAA